jgi:hypothetical protein
MLLLLPLLLLSAQPADAYTNSLYRSSARMCASLRGLNDLGRSAAPGSEGAQQIVSYGTVTASEYREAWDIARALVPSCRTLW